MLEENHSEMIKETANHYIRSLYEYCTDAIDYYTQPSFIYKPKLFIDGNKWCALYGENIQDGVAGFGDSPRDALIDFNTAFKERI